MRIRFLTATLEPGRDGVGDYTMRLAAECARRGHHTDCVAFNDGFVDKPMMGENSIRLPRALPWPERYAAAEKWLLHRPKPHWASLQFVHYSLNPKGLVNSWAPRLAALVGVTPLQMMFHEVWIGHDSGASIKKRAVGQLQRILVLSMTRALAPRLVHTSNEFYQKILQREHLDVRLLPIFGNIPFVEDPNPATTEAFLLRQFGLEKRSEALICGIFGTLHPTWPPEPLMSKLIEEGKKLSKRICIVSIGRIGPGKPLWNWLGRTYANSVSFAKMSELPPETVSHLFQALDVGIAATPYEILGKSGAATAMREHGLPLIVNRFEHAPEPDHLPDHLISPRTIDRLPIVKHTARYGADAVVDHFLADLAATAS